VVYFTAVGLKKNSDRFKFGDFKNDSLYYWATRRGAESCASNSAALIQAILFNRFAKSHLFIKKREGVDFMAS